MNDESLVARILLLRPEERDAFLDQECSDPARRRRIEAMIAADATRHSAEINADPSETERYRPNPNEASGAVIAGRYRLLQQIGEGGMGVVWMAEQSVPVKRRVALKLIRSESSHSTAILNRFEAERQAIALMDHPNIARLYDAGTTESGNPFFVMELVKGVPLTEYCDQHKLSITERLTLFQQVCLAVQHAHQKGIIHRDLKPGNILVETLEGKATPKVIDFGLAKAISGMPLTEKTLFTGIGAVMGTPMYMAPEQAVSNAIDIDTRADVYALGVILYELLTGSTPLTREQIKRAAIDEMLKLIREEEPPTPSSRISSAKTDPQIASNRQTQTEKLGKDLKGELDWIVLKAISKDRDRRYDSANGFANDIARFLNCEPVQAGPPSQLYRIQKFIRRHKGQVVAASLLLVAMIAGIGGTTWGMITARNEAGQKELARADEAKQRKLAETNRERAEASQRLAEQRLAEAETEKKRANEQKQIATAVRKFLEKKILAQADIEEQFDSLQSTGADAQEIKRNPTIREVLDRAATGLTPDRINESFPDAPFEQAEILRTVGNTYRAIGELPTAIKFLERSKTQIEQTFGVDHNNTLTHSQELADAYIQAGKNFEGAQLLEKIVSLRRERLGDSDSRTITAMQDLAIAYTNLERHEDAIALLETALEGDNAMHPPGHEKILISKNNLARAYDRSGYPEKALPLFEESWKGNLRLLGPDHPKTIVGMRNVAICYLSLGKSKDAVPLLEEVIQQFREKRGPDHPDTLRAMNDLAAGYWNLNQLHKSIPLFEDLRLLCEKKLGVGHPETLNVTANLGVNYLDAGDTDKAIPLLEQVFGFSDQQPSVSWVGTILLEAYVKAQRTELAAQLADRLLRDFRKQFPKDSIAMADALSSIGASLVKMKDYVQAERILREVNAIRQKLQPDSFRTFRTQSVLGAALLAQGKLTEAETMLLSGYEGLAQRADTISPTLAICIPEALDRLIELYKSTNRPEEQQKYEKLRAEYPPINTPVEEKSEN